MTTGWGHIYLTGVETREGQTQMNTETLTGGGYPTSQNGGEREKSERKEKSAKRQVMARS
jgi:hypothetical protein